MDLKLNNNVIARCLDFDKTGFFYRGIKKIF